MNPLFIDIFAVYVDIPYYCIFVYIVFIYIYTHGIAIRLRDFPSLLKAN